MSRTGQYDGTMGPYARPKGDDTAVTSQLSRPDSE